VGSVSTLSDASTVNNDNRGTVGNSVGSQEDQSASNQNDANPILNTTNSSIAENGTTTEVSGLASRSSVMDDDSDSQGSDSGDGVDTTILGGDGTDA